MTNSYLSESGKEELRNIAQAIIQPGKGILAADEPPDVMGNRFLPVNIENSVENRRFYRELLFRTSQSAEHISGVILYHETLGQTTKDDGIPFPRLLQQANIIPGIQLDTGTVTLAGTENETITEGLDGLEARCRQYKEGGAQFGKWRAVFRIGPNMPSQLAINENASALARYASVSQQCGLVPIIEPDILQDGDHDLLECQRVTEKVLVDVYKALNDHNIFLEGTLLKPSMVTAGKESANRYTAEEIAEATVLTLRRTVPVAVPGILFLSGGHSQENATIYLNAINRVQKIKPWALSFSYGRALQSSVLRVWNGDRKNVEKAQQEYLRLVKRNGLASLGKYEHSV